MSKKTIKMAVPKGSLQKLTGEFFSKSGIPLEGYGVEVRNYRPTIEIPGVEIKVLRPQEIPVLISRGYYDIGISGLDWYEESRCQRNVQDILDLKYGKVDIVLAVPDNWDDVTKPEELFNKFDAYGRSLRIWTEYLNLTEEFIFNFLDMEPTILSPYQMLSRGRHSPVILFHSFGATESKPPEDGEAIVDNTSTGGTLRANGLKIIHKLLPNSTARLFVNRRSLQDQEKQERIDIIKSSLSKNVPDKFENNQAFKGHISW